jgi:putative inorganic carbon (hco3(-)) transporter
VITPIRVGDQRGVVAAERPGPGAPSVATWPWVAGAFAASALLGVWVTRDPSLLHVEVTLSAGSLVPLTLALALTVVILRNPAVGLVLLVGAVYLNLSQVLVRHHGFPSMLQLLVVPLLLAGLVDWASARAGGRLRIHPEGPQVVVALVVLHVLTVLLSTTVAHDRTLADARVVEVLKGLAVILLVLLLMTGRARARAAAWTLVGSGTLLAGLALVQTTTGDFGNDFGGLARVKHAHIHGNVFQPRIAGPLGDPNYFAQVLLVLVPVALFLAWEESSRKLRALALGCGGLVVAATVLTYSRGGALALGVVFVLFLASREVNLRRATAGLLVVLAAGYLLPQDFTQRLATVSEILPGQEEEVLPRDSSFRERLLLAGVAWEMFRDRPVLGVGAGNYTIHFDDYLDRVGSAARDYGGADESRYPHNLYLELGAEGGVAGLASFLAAMVGVLALLGAARRRFRVTGDPFLAGLATAVAIALVGYLVSSVFLHGHFQRYLWLLVGLGIALGALASRSTASSAEASAGVSS